MSWRNSLITWALRRWVKPGSLLTQSVAASRARTERVPFGAKLAPDWRVRVDPARNGEWIEPEAADHPAHERCILYLHGGAYIAMSARTHRSVTSRLACWSDARLFALDYRLAPEHPFPAALDDALAAWRALVASGMAPSRIVVAGDSAGGGLALALLVALRDAGEEMPAAGVLLSPWTDLAVTGKSIVTNDAADPLFFGRWVAPIARIIWGHAGDRSAGFTGLRRPDRVAAAADPGGRHRGAAGRFPPCRRERDARRRNRDAADLAWRAARLADIRADFAGGTRGFARSQRVHSGSAGVREAYPYSRRAASSVT